LSTQRPTGIPWSRGVKISVSFSCASELLTKIEEFKQIERMNLSQCVSRLVTLGLVYSQLLEEQAASKARETKQTATKKKGKRKTPSKTK